MIVFGADRDFRRFLGFLGRLGSFHQFFLLQQDHDRGPGLHGGVVDLSLGIFLDHGVQFFQGCLQLLGVHGFRLGIVLVDLGCGQFSRGRLCDGFNQLPLDGLGFLDATGHHYHDADGFRSFHLYCTILVNGSIFELYFIRHGASTMATITSPASSVFTPAGSLRSAMLRLSPIFRPETSALMDSGRSLTWQVTDSS